MGKGMVYHMLTMGDCCSWRFASASLPHIQFWTTQLCS